MRASDLVRVVDAVRRAGSAGLTGTQISREVFCGHRSAASIRLLGQVLCQLGLVRLRRERPAGWPDNGGRRVTRWLLTGPAPRVFSRTPPPTESPAPGGFAPVVEESYIRYTPG